MEKLAKEGNLLAYTEQELIDILDWDPLFNEEWNGFHIASSISAMPNGKIKKMAKHTL